MEEEIAPTIKSECSREDEHDVVEVKYVQANDEIELSRNFLDIR